MKINILGLEVNNIDSEKLLLKIEEAINSWKNLRICGCNAHTLNILANDKQFFNSLRMYDIIHPDGIGIFLASKILYGIKGFSGRMTGSDFIESLGKRAIEKDWQLFIFGDTEETLSIISSKSLFPVSGMNCGFNFDSQNVINRINQSDADILIVGLGTPLQEKWVSAHSVKIKTPVIITIGEGIRVLAGTKKRGPVFLRRLGLEWLVRLFYNPKKFAVRYLIGNPLFILRVFKEKLKLWNYAQIS